KWSEGIARSLRYSNTPSLHHSNLFTAPAKENGRRAGCAKCQTKGPRPIQPKARQDGNWPFETDPSNRKGKIVLPPNRPAEWITQAARSAERQQPNGHEVTGALPATNRSQGRAGR